MKIKGIEQQPINPQDRLVHTVESANPKADKKLWKACQNFESLFMGYLVKSMERTLPQGTLSGSGLPDLMFNQVMGSALSEGGGIGLAEVLYRDLQAQHPQDPSENESGMSLRDLLTPPVGKDNDDESTSR
jgi:flagellar protein FlgJ